ncbi:RNA polymerase II elongation factor ELL2-like protein [Cricetulus griseus]|nr:RNA polymerase II elongation factor ELL2-like protein [Cricetulus griseus]
MSQLSYPFTLCRLLFSSEKCESLIVSTLKTVRNLIPFRPSIQFQGLQGLVKIPKNDPLSEVHNFNFYLSNVGKDNPQGSFDCIQQTLSSSLTT